MPVALFVGWPVVTVITEARPLFIVFFVPSSMFFFNVPFMVCIEVG